MSLCFLSVFDAQIILRISLDFSEKSLNIHHDNETNKCVLQNSGHSSSLCSNLTNVPKNDTLNIQLPLQMNMLRFSYDKSVVYISEIEYEEYFCMIEFYLNDLSCTRVIIHRSEIERCFEKMFDIPTWSAITEQDKQSISNMFVTCFLIGALINFTIVCAYIVITILSSHIRRRRECKAILRSTYLPIRPRSYRI